MEEKCNSTPQPQRKRKRRDGEQQQPSPPFETTTLTSHRSLTQVHVTHRWHRNWAGGTSPYINVMWRWLQLSAGLTPHQKKPRTHASSYDSACSYDLHGLFRFSQNGLCFTARQGMVTGLMMSWKMPGGWMSVLLRISMKLQQMPKMMNIVFQRFHQTQMQLRPLVVLVPPLKMGFLELLMLMLILMPVTIETSQILATILILHICLLVSLVCQVWVPNFLFSFILWAPEAPNPFVGGGPESKIQCVFLF
mmetsp:Transcript_9215/g.16365  ORF Transcript_9215/g.16365 Transcript_9215/m.16365 type:complete len:250 (+) Transcript_9215:89-838(+)